MSEHLKLRDYQTEAIESTFAAWADGIRRPAVVLPTGMGKTVVFAHLIDRFIYENPRSQILVLVHRDELADQAIKKIREVSPELIVGKVKAEFNEIGAQVLVCSVQTLAVPKRLAQVQRAVRVGLIITDECHHAVAESWKKIYATFPEALNVGFTATLARGDGIGLGDVWDEVVCSKSVLYGISKGYLTDVRGQEVTLSSFNLGGVKTSRGDYQSGDLGRALEESDLSEVLPKAYLEHAADRPGVVFTPTVETATDVADSFNDAGIKTAVISGNTPTPERQKIYEDYRQGRTQVLSNCMVLTEGFDAPWASCAVIARPTQSTPLYIQMVGRVLRPHPGKTDALVLDVVGASANNKLSTLVDLAPEEVSEINTGESLAEAVLREDKEQEEKKGGFVVSKSSDLAMSLKLKNIDLFEGSSQAWLLTDKGVMFIPVGDGEVFLWKNSAQDGTWDVCYAPKTGKWQRLRTSLSLGMAQAWAETEADERMPFNTGRSASWRRKKASEKQLGLARNLGLNVSEKMNSGEVGNLISRKFATKKFDRYVK